MKQCGTTIATILHALQAMVRVVEVKATFQEGSLGQFFGQKGPARASISIKPAKGLELLVVVMHAKLDWKERT